MVVGGYVNQAVVVLRFVLYNLLNYVCTCMLSFIYIHTLHGKKVNYYTMTTNYSLSA